MDQQEAPYLDAIVAYAEREPGRFHVPGHKGGEGRTRSSWPPSARRRSCTTSRPGSRGWTSGPDSPFQRAQRLAAEAWGAKRSWFLISGASQGNHAACLALRHAGRSVVAQRNVHSSTVDGIVLAGLEPAFVAPELDAELGIAHCLTPESSPRRWRGAPDAVAALTVSPTYFGAVADVRGLAEVAHCPRHPAGRRRGLGSPSALLARAAGERPRMRGRPGALIGPQAVRQPHPVRDPAPGPRRVHRPRRDRSLRHADRVDEPERAAHRLTRRRPPAGGGSRGGAPRRDASRESSAPARRSARSRGSTSSTSASSGAPASTRGTRCGSRWTCAEPAAPGPGSRP